MLVHFYALPYAGRIFFCFMYGRLAMPRVEALKKIRLFYYTFLECTFMRIRTANGVGFVRLWLALVIVLVLVMSGSVAFGQQSGRVVKSKKATEQNIGVQQSSKKGSDAPMPRLPKEADVKIQDYSTGPVYVDADGPADGPRTSPPPFTEPASPYNSAGGGFDGGGGSSSGSTQPPDVEKTMTTVCRCPEVYIHKATNIYKCNASLNDNCATKCATPLTFDLYINISYQAGLVYNEAGHHPTGNEVCERGSYDKWWGDGYLVINWGCSEVERITKYASGNGQPTGGFLFTGTPQETPGAPINVCRGSGL